MTPFVHFSSALFAAFAFLSSLQQPDFTGDWYFDRFGGPHGEVAKGDSIDKATKKWTGYKFTFTRDGKCKTTEVDGTRDTKFYQYIPEQRLVILEGDTMKIMLLTSRSLELYPTNGRQPALFLRRSKEVGVASAQ